MTKSRNIRHRFMGIISDEELMDVYIVGKLPIYGISQKYDVSQEKISKSLKRIGCSLRKGAAPFIELIPGKKYYRLTYLRETESHNNHRRGMFLCECGNKVTTGLYDVSCGHTRSCGCYHTERQRDPKSHGETMGRNNSPEYRAWKAMKARCYNKNNISYVNYGERGITVCRSWLNDFSVFLNDMGRKPSPQHSLDRIDNNGDYKPENCKWSTKADQRRNNRQGVHPVTINGVTRLICDWAKISGVPEESISARLRNGWDVDVAVFHPIRLQRRDA